MHKHRSFVPSEFALKRLTGQHFEYNPFVVQRIREIQANRWQTWLATQGSSASLLIPMQAWQHRSEPRMNGHTLLALCERNKVVEYDEDWNEVWSFEFQKPCTAERMANGNTLVSSYEQGVVVEVTPDKQVLRRMSVKEVESARPLDNGNILITSKALREIRDIDLHDEVVWSVPSTSIRKGWFTDAIRLTYGHTLAVEKTWEGGFGYTYDIVEFDRAGSRVWQFRTYEKDQPFIQPLENGNVLMARENDLVEIDRFTNELVGFLPVENSGGGALPLKNGNLLARQSDRIIAVSRDGKELWSKPVVSNGSMRREAGAGK